MHGWRMHESSPENEGSLGWTHPVTREGGWSSAQPMCTFCERVGSGDETRKKGKGPGNFFVALHCMVQTRAHKNGQLEEECVTT